MVETVFIGGFEWIREVEEIADGADADRNEVPYEGVVLEDFAIVDTGR